MISKISLYCKRIDKKIFEQLGLVNKSPIYEDFLGGIESLSSGRGKLVAMVLAGVMIILPLFVALMFWWGNSSLKKNLEVKKDITQLIQDYKLKEAVSVPLKSQGIAGALSKTKEDFFRSINLSLEKKQSVIVEKLKYKRVSTRLGRSVISLNFGNFTTKALIDMIEKLVYRQKAKVSRIHIEKDKILKTLNGNIELIIHGIHRTKEEDEGK